MTTAQRNSSTRTKHRALGREASLLPILDAWLKGWAEENLKPDAEWVERVTP